MSKLTNSELRNLIMQEISRMVGEEALISKDSAGADSYRDTGFRPNARSPHNLTTVKQSDSYDDFGGGETGTCEQCGGMTYEGDCMESDCGTMEEIFLEGKMCEQCGGSSMYEGECSECGYMGEGMLNEGNCSSCGPADDGSDYSTDTMGMIGDALGVLTHAGYEVDATKGDHRSHNNYMAKPSLYKVAKYAQKLLHMIPDGYELDDWQRTKIAQISDDISEVYHSLDYDFYDDDC